MAGVKKNRKGKSDGLRKNRRSVWMISFVIILLGVVILGCGVSLKEKNKAYQAKEEELRLQIEAEKERSEEIDELKTAMEQGKRFDIEDEFGDVLFSCVNIARFIDVDSEEALTASTDKFMSRFSLVEQMASEQGIDMKSSSIEELDRLWDKAKKIKNSEKSVMED